MTKKPEKPDLAGVSEDDLHEEIRRRKQARYEAECAERDKHREHVLANVDGLLAFVTDHGRTSCSDQKPVNEGRCNRCTLLEIKKSGYTPDDLLLSVEITRRTIPNPNEG